MSFNREDGLFYLWSRDFKYIEWKRQNEIWNTLDNVGFVGKSVDEYIEYIGRIGGDFFVIEKFKKGFDYDDLRYYFIRKEIDLRGLPILFENV